MAQEFSQSSVHKYFPLQEKQMRILVRNILKDPTQLDSEVALYVTSNLILFRSLVNLIFLIRRIGAVMLRLTYGYHVKKADDPFLAGAITALRNFIKLTTPGAFLVDLIPACEF
jgi:hypothetical protein